MELLSIKHNRKRHGEIVLLPCIQKATLTQYGHASPLAGEVQQCQQLILASDTQLGDSDAVSCSGEEDPAQLPGCPNERFLVWGRGLVDRSLWRNEADTQSGCERVVYRESSCCKSGRSWLVTLVPLRQCFHLNQQTQPSFHSAMTV